MSTVRWTACAAAALLLAAAACGRSTRTADEPAAAPPAGETGSTAQMSAAPGQKMESASPCDAQPRNHVIVVGATVSCKQPHVSKGAGNLITWRSASGENIEVVFKPKAGVNPFPSLTCPGNTPICNSGAIDPAANGSYDYDVWLYTGGGKQPIDPTVIIDP